MQKVEHIRDDITITAEVEKQLRDGVSPAEVKISLRLTCVKDLRKRPEIITNGFEAAVINEACVNART